ncbi:MAG: ABC transporter ATP-binding protein, partial [Acidimicrobiales bacterium]
MPPEGAGADEGGAAALEVAHVGVHFGGVAALSDVSLRAEAGTVTGLIGPNGAGKTTLFNVISGLQRPDSGSVSLGGTDVTRKGTYRRARLGLARTFQRLELFSSLSAVDNVRVGLEAFGHGAQSAAIGLLERVGVGEEAGAPVSSLPTGSARLVELARALSTEPKVLLLDEPCSGLDERESEALGYLLTSLAAEGRAVVLVEHDTDLVLRICGTVHVLDFGQVIASGPPDDVRRNPS